MVLLIYLNLALLKYFTFGMQINRFKLAHVVLITNRLIAECAISIMIIVQKLI